MIAVTMRFTVLMSHMWDGFDFASSAGLSLLDGGVFALAVMRWLSERLQVVWHFSAP